MKDKNQQMEHISSLFEEQKQQMEEQIDDLKNELSMKEQWASDEMAQKDQEMDQLKQAHNTEMEEQK